MQQTNQSRLTNVLESEHLGRPQVGTGRRQLWATGKLRRALKLELVPNAVKGFDELGQLLVRVERAGRNTQTLAANRDSREVWWQVMQSGSD